ncbi:hypothetical protein HMPREF0063_11905 [Aeromicrobium marinum DSM 15272]|uniref:Minor tail protein n=1 Tax=Aeromicrobium marinum DSM 15272 TaxID=585531 RepID=E2SDW9_9ACTN|nr:hypothetical protein [Aeromicrobium marinum]EFQ82696.1 hypothetical protein HMPREF0063_11905 [Aeromicrobium marinum DSM 15272]
MSMNQGFPAAEGPSFGALASDVRRDISGLLSLNSGDSADVRLGVFRDSDVAIVSGTSATSPPTYSVRALVAVVEGPVLVATTGTTIVESTAPPGSNPRIDVIWIRQRRISGDGGSETDPIAELGVTQGSPNPVPAVPAIPAGALALAQSLVQPADAATNAADITQTHRWTVARGAPIPVRTLAERATITPVVGTRVLRLDTGGIQRYDPASVWVDDGAGPVVSAFRSLALDPAPTAVGTYEVPFTGVDEDPAGMWSAGNPGRLTAKVAGVYRLSATGGWNSPTTVTGAQISVNGTPVRLGITTGTAQQTAQVEVHRRLNVGDFATMQMYNERSGGNTILTVADRRPLMTAQWIAP